MAQHPPDTGTPADSAPDNERRGSSGPGLAPALVAIFGLLALGGAVALGFAILFIIGGLGGPVLYVSRMSSTRVSRVELPPDSRAGTTTRRSATTRTRTFAGRPAPRHPRASLSGTASRGWAALALCELSRRLSTARAD